MFDRRPLPVRVRDELVELFQSRGLKSGDRVPTEAEIAQLCDVGRSTAREALKLLEQEGLLEVERGRGRYLTSVGTLRVERPVTRFESVTHMLHSRGYQCRNLVLSVAELEATDEQWKALNLTPGSQVISLERLRLDGETDEPLIYSVNTIPRNCIPGPIKHIDWTGSLNALMAAQGYPLVSSAARLRAVTLPSKISDRYSLGDISPWLLIAETVVSTSGERVLYSEDYHRGDAFAFNVLRR